MRQTLILITIVFISFAGSYLAKKALQKHEPGVYNALRASVSGNASENDSGDDVNTNTTYRRIISLAPSITEILFKLGLGDKVVGVTDYCDFPPEAQAKAKIGGYYDPNYEAIIALRPNIVIMLPEHQGPKQYLSRFGLKVLIVDHKSISGILSSITAIGNTCGVEQNAASLVLDLQKRMERIKQKTNGLTHPKVMVTVGRNMGSGSLRDIYISGRDGFYDEMITLSGGINAYTGSVTFPVVSGEGIIRMNPEVIIDIIPDLEQKGWDKTMIIKEWKTIPQVDAVKNSRVYIFGEDYVATPGPRFILIMEQMARAIHPEIN